MFRDFGYAPTYNLANHIALHRDSRFSSLQNPETSANVILNEVKDLVYNNLQILRCAQNDIIPLVL